MKKKQIIQSTDLSFFETFILSAGQRLKQGLSVRQRHIPPTNKLKEICGKYLGYIPDLSCKDCIASAYVDLYNLYLQTAEVDEPSSEISESVTDVPTAEVIDEVDETGKQQDPETDGSDGSETQDSGDGEPSSDNSEAIKDPEE